MKIEKSRIVIILVLIIITVGFTVDSIYKINEFKGSIQTNSKIIKDLDKKKELKDAIVVKSDGKQVAIVKNISEIKELLDNIKKEYINLNKIQNVNLVKLNSEITYYKTKLQPDKIKNVKQWVKNIVEGHDNIWNIKFTTIKEDTNKTMNKKQRSITNTSNNKIDISSVVSRGVVSSGFGMRWGRMHNGIDLAAKMGTPIHAVLPGKVIYSGWQDGYGNVVKIDNENKLVTIYGHCSKLCVKKGDNIKKSDKIAEVGSTGRSTGPHVHFEVRKNGKPQQPEPYIR